MCGRAAPANVHAMAVMARRRRCSAASGAALVVAACLASALGARAPDVVRQASSRLLASWRRNTKSRGTCGKGFFQCNRQCRWHYDFFDRSIEGRRSDSKSCECFRDGMFLGSCALFSPKTFDTKHTWSGGVEPSGKRFGFDSDEICVELGGQLRTVSRLEFERQPLGKPLHCGACAACSRAEDIEVLARTRGWITDVMTGLSTKFAAPLGHHNVTKLAEDLHAVGFTLSNDKWRGANRASCMECWMDNIMCDVMTCWESCWAKLVKLGRRLGPDSYIDRDPAWWNIHAKCLMCDEMKCGAEFIQCAGANRRSSGIVSDIPRPREQQCVYGMYFGVPAADLPTSARPTKA